MIHDFFSLSEHNFIAKKNDRFYLAIKNKKVLFEKLNLAIKIILYYC